MKTQLVLTLYNLLLFGERIDRKIFCQSNQIAERTFYRYIKEINIFIMHAKQNYVLMVDEPDGVYYFENING